MKSNNIILIGFMGCGKTTFGKWIAAYSHMEFADTDEIIEGKEGRSISDIFSSDGEEYFRSLETLVIEDMIGSCRNTIISVGGGLPVREINRQLLKKLGTCVYLRTSKEELVRRLRQDTTRPLLKGGSLEKKIDELMAARENIYQDASDLVLDTDGMSMEAMAAELGLCKDEGLGERHNHI